MTTLTDRYVWGVLRAVPEPQRAELEPEIRAMVDDAVEARAARPGRTAKPPTRWSARRSSSSATPSCWPPATRAGRWSSSARACS